jgi:hypothetical protein
MLFANADLNTSGKQLKYTKPKRLFSLFQGGGTTDKVKTPNRS